MRGMKRTKQIEEMRITGDDEDNRDQNENESENERERENER
jgi:hypothetical protein